MMMNLSVMLVDREIKIGPVDEFTRDWLRDDPIHMDMPLARLRKSWANRGVARNDLRIIAAQLEQDLNAEERGFALAMRGGQIERVFRVRAYEYRVVSMTQELEEIR